MDIGSFIKDTRSAITSYTVKSPLPLVSEIGAGKTEAFEQYLKKSGYVWRRRADGTIIGRLDRGFDRFYHVEWQPDNTLMAMAHASNRNSMVKIAFAGGDENSLKLRAIFESLVKT